MLVSLVVLLNVALIIYFGKELVKPKPAAHVSLFRCLPARWSTRPDAVVQEIQRQAQKQINLNISSSHNFVVGGYHKHQHQFEHQQVQACTQEKREVKVDQLELVVFVQSFAPISYFDVLTVYNHNNSLALNCKIMLMLTGCSSSSYSSRRRRRHRQRTCFGYHHEHYNQNRQGSLIWWVNMFNNFMLTE